MKSRNGWTANSAKKECRRGSSRRARVSNGEHVPQASDRNGCRLITVQSHRYGVLRGLHLPHPAAVLSSLVRAGEMVLHLVRKADRCEGERRRDHCLSCSRGANGFLAAHHIRSDATGFRISRGPTAAKRAAACTDDDDYTPRAAATSDNDLPSTFSRLESASPFAA